MSTYNRWVMVILVLMLVSTTAVQMVSADTAHVANHVVISEIYIDEVTTGSEWIELYNPTNTNINIGEWVIDTKSDGEDDVTLPSGAEIPSHGFYFIGDETSGVWTPDNPHWPTPDYTETMTLTDVNGWVRLRKSTGGELVDIVGWGAATIFETFPASKPAEGKSIERKAIASSTASDMASGGDHYTWGNGEDMNNNSADFITKTTPDPQNSSSATEDCPAQSWFLHNDSVMYKENMSKPEDTVTVSDGSSTIWEANEPAAVDLGFPAGTWTGTITLIEPFVSGETFTVEVGSYEDSTFTSAGLQTCTGAIDKITFSLEIPATAFDILNGNYLALNITNPSDGSTNLVIKTGGGNSYVTSPETDPSYPVPELASIILFSTGLLMLAGYAYMTRRNK